MNWDRIEGNWKQMKGKVKQQWGKLTDDDMDVIAGKRDEMVGRTADSSGASNMSTVWGGGSSRVFRRQLAASSFMRSASPTI